MSLPDRDLTLVEALRYFRSGELTEVAAEDCIKALMLELVGEDDIQSRQPEGTAKDWKIRGRNALRRELRSNINKL